MRELAETEADSLLHELTDLARGEAELPHPEFDSPGPVMLPVRPSLTSRAFMGDLGFDSA